MPAGHREPVAAAPGRFITTRWSLVVSAGIEVTTESGRALEELFGLYWQPLYYFIRRQGSSVEEAEDLLQGFFVHLLEKETLGRADRERGRFRSFLLGCLKRYVSDERGKAQAQKRGGDQRRLSVDVQSVERSFALEPADGMTPEKIFELRWVMTLLELAKDRLRLWYESRGKQLLFEKLKGHLTKEVKQPPYRQIADELEMTEGSVKAAAYEMRRRFGEFVRAEIGETVRTAEEIDQEIQDLFAVFDR